MFLNSSPDCAPHRSRLIRRLAIIAVLLFSTLAGLARADEIDDAFTHPSDTARPLVYWFWMGRNVTAAGITHDLEAIKAAGFGGATMCHLTDTVSPWPANIENSPFPENVPYVSDEWWKLLHHAGAEARRLGLTLGFHNCPGYESNGGPWITPALSMQEVVFSQTPVSGPGSVTINLPRPKVNPRSAGYPVFNEDNGKLENPEIPARNSYFEDIAVLALPADGVAPKDRVLDLSANLSPDGQLHWNPPEGKWIVYRFGHTTTGTLIQPAPWKATGLECDKMNPDAITLHMNYVLGHLKKFCGDVIGNGPGLEYVWFDSYEARTPSWTPRMREEFRSRRGYDLTPFLAKFAKRVVGSEAETKKFAADFDRTIKDLYREVDFGLSAKLAHEAGVQIRSEPYGGPWVVSEAIPKFDQVAAEFWTTGGKYSPYAVGEVVAGCRKAHQNIVTAEAFTGKPEDSKWTETPEWLKPFGDAAFCDGVNRLMLHRFTSQPFDEKYKPGLMMGQWGTHFDRTQTWWEPGKAWIKYIQRCQGLLQWGEYAGAAGDFQAAGDGADAVRAIHRHGAAGDVYFVANLKKESRTVNATFAIQGRQPEWWDAVTGTTRELKDFTMAGGRTTIPLRLDPAQSGFMVFRHPVQTTPAEHPGNFAEARTLVELKPPWSVTFDPKWGGPDSPVQFDALVDWTARPEPGIRYYSGTAVYRTTFDGPSASEEELSLDLGVVHDLARVRLNGSDLGVAWTAPWRVAIPAGLLRPHGNQLEIELTNCWANRLIGDEQEPADCEWAPGHQGSGGYLKRFPDWFVQGSKRPSQGRYTFTTWNYFNKDSKLSPSGLLGPVRVVSGDGPLQPTGR